MVEWEDSPVIMHRRGRAICTKAHMRVQWVTGRYCQWPYDAPYQFGEASGAGSGNQARGSTR